MDPTMEGVNAVSGSLAKCFMTIGGIRYNFMSLISFEAKMEKKIAAVPILGKPGKGHKPCGWEGTWTGKAHYNQSVLRAALARYRKTGEDAPFEVQVTNEDPSAGIGRQTVVLKGCLSSGGILTKFDSAAEYLDEDLSGTFDDWNMPEQFKKLPGMV